jgi:hypothetical protein
MDVLGVPVANLDASLIDRLVAEKVLEDARIEFKRQLPQATEADRIEFVKDVSAFANGRGGTIIYGVAEISGTASAILGLGTVDKDAEQLRLQQTLRSGIQPRIGGLALRWVHHPKGPVLAIGVPRSLAAPHMVTANHTGQFWARASGGKYLMDVTAIRQAMLAAGEWERAAGRFRDARNQRLRDRLGMRGLSGGELSSFTCFHWAGHATGWTYHW